MGEDRPAFAILVQALGSPDAEAARALLTACAPAHPDLFLRYLDAAFHWLHPDRIEPLAADLLRHLPAPLASNNVKSHRLRLLLRESGLNAECGKARELIRDFSPITTTEGARTPARVP